MNINLSVLVASLIASTVSTAAPKAIDSSTYIRKLVENDPQIQKILISKDIRNYNLAAEISDWTLNASATATQKAINDEGNPTNKVLKVSSSIPQTSTSISLTHTMNQESAYSEDTVISVEQKLIKDGFGSNYDRNMSKTELNETYAKIEMEEAIEGFFLRAIHEYLDWYKLYIQKKHFDKARREALRLEKHQQKRFKQGMTLESDYLKAKVRRKEIEEKLSAREKDFLLKSRQLGLLSGLDETATPSPIKIVDTRPRKIEDLRKSRTKSLQTKLQQLSVDSYQDDLSPAADLSLGVGQRKIVATGKTQPYFIAGLNFDMGVVQKQKTRVLALGKLQHRNAQLDEKVTRNNLTIEMREIKSNMEQTLLKKDSVLENLKIYKRILNQENHRYKKGLVSFKDLLSAQESFDNQTLKLEETKIDIQKLKASYLEINDRLLPAYRSTIPSTPKSQ